MEAEIQELVKQQNILNEICQNFFSNSRKFDSLEYEYKFNPDEGWCESNTIARINGKIESLELPFEVRFKNQELSQKLHDEMQSHTGGDWRKFILTIDENGEAKTKFIYEIQSCMDEFNDD